MEIDETYVDEKAKNKHGGKPGTSAHTPVIGAVSRKGRVVARVIANTDTETLDGFARAVVSTTALTISTDEHAGYRLLKPTYNHGIVRHAAKQYRAGDFHTNTIEGVWAQLKRQIIGVYHWV